MEQKEHCDIILKDEEPFRKPTRFVKYKCKRCSRKYKDIRLLHDHLQVHKNKTEAGKYKCKFCPELFSDFFEFIRHKKSHRSADFNKKCLPAVSKCEIQTTPDPATYPELVKEIQLLSSQNGRHEDTIQQVQGHHDGMEQHRADGNIYELHMGPDNPPNTSHISPASHSSTYSSSLIGNGERKSCENFVKIVGNDSLKIDSPMPIRNIQLTTSTPELHEIVSQMDKINSKLDAIIRHFNVPLGAQHVDESPSPAKTFRPSKRQRTSTSTSGGGNTAPGYHVITKEQEPHDFYTPTVTPTNIKSWALSTSPTMYSNPSTGYAFSKEDHTNDNLKFNNTAPPALNPVASPLIKSSGDVIKDYMLTEDQIEKLYVVSRSRGNFAKNLTFAVYSAEERHGRNCTGRVFGKAIPKGQLDQSKLNYVKEITFRKYPCHPSLVDFTWKKKCVTAIDSGLRNENRVRSRRHGPPRTIISHAF